MRSACSGGVEPSASAELIGRPFIGCCVGGLGELDADEEPLQMAWNFAAMFPRALLLRLIEEHILPADPAVLEGRVEHRLPSFGSVH